MKIRFPRRARRIVLPIGLVAALGATAAGCGFWKPQGNGGWTPEQRVRELERARALSGSAPTRSAGSADPPSASPAPAVPATIDLATALELAERHNRSVRAAEAALDASAADVSIARSALLPTAGVRGAYTWYSDEQTNSIDIDPALFPPGTAIPVVTVRQQDFATVGAAIRLAVDLSGELRHGLGAAQASYRAEAARNWATQLEEQAAVLTAYFQLLEAERLRDVAKRTVALHERQLSDASSRYEQGRLTRNEVLVVEVALATSRQHVLQMETAMAAARRRLNRAVGLDISAPTAARDIAGRPDLPALETALEAAHAKNPLVQAMLEEVRAADERLTAVRRARLPRVSVGAGYDATTADILQPNNYASLGVNVDFDVVSLRREGEIARLDAAARRSRVLLDRGVREVEALVGDSHDRVRERLAAVDAATVAVGQADENLRIRQVQFDEGRATSEDLLDAAELSARQRGTLAAALYQAHARRAELQQLMGEPLAELAVVTSTTAPPAAKGQGRGEGRGEVPR